MYANMHRVDRNHPACFGAHGDLGPRRKNTLSFGIVLASQIGDEILATESDRRNAVRTGVADLLYVHNGARRFDERNNLESPDRKSLFVFDRLEQLAEEIDIFAFLAFGIHEPGDSFDGQLIDVAQQLAAFPVVDAGIKHTAPEPSVGKIAQDVVARHLLVGGRLDRVFDVEQQHVGIDACGTAHQPVVMGRDEHQASE